MRGRRADNYLPRPAAKTRKIAVKLTANDRAVDGLVMPNCERATEKALGIAEQALAEMAGNGAAVPGLTDGRVSQQKSRTCLKPQPRRQVQSPPSAFRHDIEQLPIKYCCASAAIGIQRYFGLYS
jgi:hypothetical protein